VVDIERRGRVRLPTGSLQIAARWTTASKPSRSSTSTLRTSLRMYGKHGRRGPEPAVGIQIHVNAHDLMARTPQHRHQHRADISVVSRHERVHALPDLQLDHPI
jgi:hypothetical protein